jgi:competence protein ComEC
MDVLWPQTDLINENVLNNNSIVCKLVYMNCSILFTGDIEEIAEKKMLELYGSKVLNSTILKVAHHGSKSSSIKEFVSKVNPKVALIGVGENNKFGHPNENVLERLKINRYLCLQN